VKLVDGANTVSEYKYDGAKRRTIQKSYVSGTLDETRHLYYTEPKKWQVIEERIGTSTNPEQQHVWSLRYIDDCILRDRDTTNNGTLDERLYPQGDCVSSYLVNRTCDRYSSSQPAVRRLFLIPTLAAFSFFSMSVFHWLSAVRRRRLKFAAA